MARRRYGEVTSGSGKSHQGRRITMAQPVSSILGDVVKSSRSIARSGGFEGHKLIQTNSRQLILLDLNILYWCPASRDQIKPLLVQPQISCNASGLVRDGVDGEHSDTTAISSTSGSSSSSRRSSSRRKQQQQQEEATAAGGSSSKQQHGAASSRQAAGEQQVSSNRWAATGKQQQVRSSKQQQVAGKQQASSNQRLPPWKNDQIYLKKINALKKMNFFQAHGPKTMKSFNY